MGLKYQKIFNFFMNFDALGKPPNLYIKGKTRLLTFFGFNLTILLFFLSFCCLLFFGQNLYYKQNPKISNHQEYEPYPERFVVDPEINPFLLEINTPLADKYFTDRSMLRATVNQITMSKLENGTMATNLQTYELEICTKSHFTKGLISLTISLFKITT